MTTELVTNVHAQLREAFKLSGMKHSEVARALNCSTSYVSTVLAKDSNLTLDTLGKLAGAIGCQVEIRLAWTPSFSIGANGIGEGASDGPQATG